MSGISIFCLIYHHTYPQLFYFHNMTLTLKPINTKLCNELNGEDYVQFYLYTRSNVDQPQIIKINEEKSLINSMINFKKKTVIFTHGFTEHLGAIDVQLLKRNFLKRGDYNYIAVDARRLLAGPYYLEAAINCKFIGRMVSQFISYLINEGLKLHQLHVIGFSLGAQIAGFAGQMFPFGKLPRITGLDPAGPLFNSASTDNRLDESDADFVDVIHTNRFIFGIIKNVGHVDFYPNGGGPFQPGCAVLTKFINVQSISESIFCEHYRAFRLYAMSLLDGKRYPAKKCDNNTFLIKPKNCYGNVEYMGIDVNTSARGVYSLYTGTDASDLY